MSSREGVDLLVALNQETVQLHQDGAGPGRGDYLSMPPRSRNRPPGVKLALDPDTLLPEKTGRARSPSTPGPAAPSWGCSRCRWSP